MYLDFIFLNCEEEFFHVHAEFEVSKRLTCLLESTYDRPRFYEVHYQKLIRNLKFA